METQELEKIASQVRRDIVRMVSAVSSGHPGGSLGCADFLTVLYFDKLKHDPANFKMDALNEDVFLPVKRTYFTCLVQCFSTLWLFSS